MKTTLLACADAAGNWPRLRFLLDHPGDDERLPGQFINVIFVDSLPGQVFALNNPVVRNGILQGNIYVSTAHYEDGAPCLDEREASEHRKSLLANEWLKIIYILVHEKRPSSRLIGDNSTMMSVMAAMHRPVIWQDTDSEYASMLVGLRDLLVSDDTIRKYIAMDAEVKDLESLRAKLLDLGEAHVVEARRIIFYLADRISKEISVARDYVERRIYHVLLAPPLPQASPVIYDIGEE